jgi:CelD/BcsL family acetyltransferase involved in cellulose biosynthesis
MSLPVFYLPPTIPIFVGYIQVLNNLLGMNLIFDKAAVALLRDDEFIRNWKRLYESCQPATAFQEPEFVCAWYNAYQDKWKPLIVYTQNSQAEFTGLLLLAYDAQSKTLVHAGGEQAEYQTWLSLPNEHVKFLSLAWQQLCRQFDFATLRFRYLPSVEPWSDLLKKLPFAECIALRKRQRPLMTLNADDIKASFAKKSNKSRFNRLKKLGQVEFKRIVDIDELNRIFDEFIAFYDLRQGAVNLSKPFHEDHRKKDFHLDLFQRAGDKAYVTVTYLNGHPVAGFWGTVSKAHVHLGMLMHSPFLAEHSLGKLHLMQLSEQLLTDHYSVLDLTPGSDPWKERFANAHDEVAEAILYRSVLAKRKGELAYSMLDWLRKKANQKGITTAKLRTILKAIKEMRPGNLVNWIRSDQTFFIYHIDRSLIDQFKQDEKISLNVISDLLDFEPSQVAPSEHGFLSIALARLEAGEKVYTMKSDNRLAFCGWLKSNQEDQQSLLPKDSVTLHDLYIHPDFAQSDLYKRSLGHLLNDTFKDQSVQQAFVVVPEENKKGRQWVEELGFTFRSSYSVTSRFGRQKMADSGKNEITKD